jgi:hypothetical protein
MIVFYFRYSNGVKRGKVTESFSFTGMQAGDLILGDNSRSAREGNEFLQNP